MNLKRIKTRECSECGGVMVIEIAVTDGQNQLGEHTQTEQKIWVCQKCDAQEDYILREDTFEE